MVANLTIGRPRYSSSEKTISRVGDEGEALKQRFLEAVEEDQRDYESILDALKLPKLSEAEKRQRHQTLQASYKQAIEAPRKVGLMALQLLRLCHSAAIHGNKNAIGDTAVAAHLAHAALMGGLENRAGRLGVTCVRS
jgi:formiminotetrahydrofolate cyclodeaminase